MTRGTSLVSEAEVVQLTGQQTLTQLEAAAEFDRADLLTASSNAIYDQLEQAGIDPTALTNAEVYKDAVAWHFLARLALLGYITPPGGLEIPSDPYTWSDVYLRRRIPKTAGDDPSSANEGIPAVGNFEAGWVFGGEGGPRADKIRTWLPGSREV